MTPFPRMGFLFSNEEVTLKYAPTNFNTNVGTDGNDFGGPTEPAFAEQLKPWAD